MKNKMTIEIKSENAYKKKRINFISNILSQLPKKDLKNIDSINVIVVKEYPPSKSELLGEYDSDLQKITIYKKKNTSIDSIVHTLLHEIGHSINSYFELDEEQLADDYADKMIKKIKYKK